MCIRRLTFKEKLLCELVEKSNSSFKELKKMACISDNALPTNLKRLLLWANFSLLPKIHKRLENVPGRPIISNCGDPTEKGSEYLDFHLKSIMQNGV